MSDSRRYALITSDGTVDNVVMWDGATRFDIEEGERLLPCPAHVGPGWRFTGQDWAPPIEGDAS